MTSGSNEARELTSGGTMARERILLTVLGTNPKRARYALNVGQLDAQVAPIALFDLLAEPDRPDRVLALCTAKAKQDSWPLLGEALHERCRVQPIEVPAGDTQQDVDDFLTIATGAIPESAELTVDLTHGFRHFSFLTYIAVLYLIALHGVTLRGAYYAMLNPYPTPSPFLDLRPLLELPRWIYALEVLADTGSTLPIARILTGGENAQPARDNARDLTALSDAYLSGLPLELGWQAWNICSQRRRPLLRLLRDHHQLPLADTLVEGLVESLKPFTLAQRPIGDSWKTQVQLSKSELLRQAQFIDGLLTRGSVATALRLMREWTVSWVILQNATHQYWLRRNVRSVAERLLGAFKALAADNELHRLMTDEQRDLGRFWEALAEVRNAFAHHGMRGEDLIRGGQIAATRERVLHYWRQTLRTCPSVGVVLAGSSSRVLVSPLGMRPGVLFSALHACRSVGHRAYPGLCMVICSPQTREVIGEALNRTKYRGKVEALLLEDAFGGGPDSIRQLARSAREYFVGASEVLVNVTGGTTLMGLAAEELAATARSLACPVRRFGLIDRRSPREQDSDPYIAGEAFWLDAEEDSDDN